MKLELYNDGETVIHTECTDQNHRLLTITGVNLLQSSKFNVVDTDIDKQISVNIKAQKMPSKRYMIPESSFKNQTVKVLYDETKILATISNIIYPNRGPVVEARLENVRTWRLRK